MSDDRLRRVAGVCAVLAVLAAVATAALIGLALVPADLGDESSGNWGYALIPLGFAVGFGGVAVVIWRRLD